MHSCKDKMCEIEIYGYCSILARIEIVKGLGIWA